MVSSREPHVTYVPLPDATPERELNALAAVYRFILNRHVEEKAAGVNGGEEHARKDKDVSRNQTISRH